ncbi:MAG: S24 family peptidase [Hyphomicrobiales bacterium]
MVSAFMLDMENDAETITAALRELRMRAGLSMEEVAKALGLRGASSYQRYESADQYKGGFFKRDLVAKLTKALAGKGEPAIRNEDVWALAGPEYVGPGIARSVGSEAQMSINSENGTTNVPSRTVPQIDVTAGMGGGGLTGNVNATHNGITINADQVSGVWGLPETIYARIGVPPARLAALPVQGDSMYPTLKDGDVIFVDTGHRAPSPDGVYALADDFGGVVVKRLESHGGDGIVRIISDNDRHAPYDRNVDEMFIFGRFVGRWTT